MHCRPWKGVHAAPECGFKEISVSLCHGHALMQEVFKVYSPHNLFSSESLSFNPKQVHNLFLTGFCIRRVEESAFLFAVGSLTCPCPSPMSARSVLSVSPQYHTPACRSPGPMHVSCPWGAHSLPGLRRGHNRAVIQVGWKG